jgi:hypothetical protein
MNKASIFRCLALLFAGIFWISCIPSHLAKYQGRPNNDEAVHLKEPVTAPQIPLPEGKAQATPAPKQATIFAIDNQTFKFMLKGEKVWEAAIDLLLRNYNLTIVDRESGVITTEWDSFFLDGKVFRNRISLRVRRIAAEQTELIILNNVESLRDGTGASSSVWLPSEDKAGETARIVQNLALVLKEPPPSLPPGMIAKATDSALPIETNQ